jgi:hypothetical protein
MRSRIGCGLILPVLLLTQIVLGGQHSQSSIPNSTKGFDKQYKNLFKAFEKTVNFSKSHQKNELDLGARFRTFAIPENWFTDAFGPNEGPKFAREYRKLFKSFQSATISEFEGVEAYPTSRADSAQIKTTALRTDLRWPTPSLLVPVPPVQSFQITYFTSPNRLIESQSVRIIEPGYSRSRLDSFIYMDGAFRYVGGACPFWGCGPVSHE